MAALLAFVWREPGQRPAGERRHSVLCGERCSCAVWLQLSRVYVVVYMCLCCCAVLQVCGVSVVLAGLSYPLSRFWYTRNWRRLSENELFEQKMLR
jgi:hypothetical protein